MKVEINISLCRVCLQEPSFGTSLYINQELAEKFKAITELQLNPNDPLPCKLCTNCVSRLNLAFEFKRQSEASAHHFSNFIGDVIDTIDSWTNLASNGLKTEEQTNVTKPENKENENHLGWKVVCDDPEISDLEVFEDSHMRRHTTSHTLVPAGPSFSQRDGLKRNEKLDHKAANQCSKCDRIFSTKNALSMHIKRKHSFGKAAGGKLTDGVDLRANHFETQSKKKIKQNSILYKCNKCIQTFTNKRTCINHCKKHETKLNGTIIDTATTKATDSLNVYRYDQDVKHGNTITIQCNVCKARFTDLDDLNDHFLVHKDTDLLL